MAVQPIDLQTMYSQMANVASKVSGEQHGAQMASSLQQQSAVIQNAEAAKTVQKTSGDNSKTGLVKDGSSGQQQEQSGSKHKNESEEELMENKKTEFREDFLGRHIDITR